MLPVCLKKHLTPLSKLSVMYPLQKRITPHNNRMLCGPHSLTDQRIGGVVPLGDDPQLEVFHLSLSETGAKMVRKTTAQPQRTECLKNHTRLVRGQRGGIHFGKPRRDKEKYSLALSTFISHVARSCSGYRAERTSFAGAAFHSATPPSSHPCSSTLPEMDQGPKRRGARREKPQVVLRMDGSPAF